MSVNLDQIVSQMIANLRISDPELDTSVGTTTRKILDAAAEQIAEAYIDNQLITYQYDVDSKVDADLDDFVQLFGMARLPAKRSSGIVTFYRTSNLSSTIVIPINTVVATADSPSITVQTVANSILDPGVTSIQVPAQAVDPGPAGNVAANTLVNNTVAGITASTNMSAFSGGTSQETDDQLRSRWKSTVFRSLAGTEQMYLGVALNDADCYIANVVGSSKDRREQVQIVSGVGQTTVDDASLVFDEPVFVGANIDSGDILVPGVDYTWDTTVNPPRVVVVDAAKMPNGSIFEVDFQYEPTASRNDVANGITNRVDIFVGGQRATAATQVVIFRGGTGAQFSATSSNRFYAGKFIRSDGTSPAVGNIFVPLAYGPILSVPDTITINGVIYAQADHDHPMGTTATVGSDTLKYAYRIVHQDIPLGLTPTSYFGLEWSAASGFYPTDNSIFTLDGDSGYSFNSMITDIQASIDRWRLLGVDAKVHAAKPVPLLLTVALVYVRGTNIDATNAAIDAAVANLFSQAGFQGRVQVSDIIQAIHNVTGVDNVRFLHDTDYSGYNPSNPNAYHVGIQRVIDETYDSSSDTYLPIVGESYVDVTGRPTELRFGDAELPVLHSIYKVTRAENSFGVV